MRTQLPSPEEQHLEDPQVAAGDNERKETLVRGERHHMSSSTYAQQGVSLIAVLMHPVVCRYQGHMVYFTLNCEFPETAVMFF